MVFNFSSDSRTFTDYSPPCLINQKIMKDNNITNQNEYRAFLQKNALKIMQINTENSKKSVSRSFGNL